MPCILATSLKISLSKLSADRQPASPHAIPIHDDDALSDIRFGQRGKNLAQARDDVVLAPIAVAEQDQARLAGPSDREQARIVEIAVMMVRASCFARAVIVASVAR